MGRNEGQDAYDIKYATIHFGPVDRTQYRNKLRIPNTASLRDGWTVEVTDCTGCGVD